MKGMLWHVTDSAYIVMIRDLVKQGKIKAEDADECFRKLEK